MDMQLYNHGRDEVLQDWPWTRGHSEDKFWWPWPRSNLALTWPWPWPRRCCPQTHRCLHWIIMTLN